MPTLQDRRATLRRHTATTSLTFPAPDLAARQLVYCRFSRTCREWQQLTTINCDSPTSQ